VNENVARNSVAIAAVKRDITEISNGSTEINNRRQDVKQSEIELFKTGRAA
jgi:hypothetical protein